MKLATTTQDLQDYGLSPSEIIEAYSESGFKYLDYSFCNMLTDERHPFMLPTYRDAIAQTKKAAAAHGIRFVQAHAPIGRVLGDGAGKNLVATERAIKTCGMLGIKNMVIHSGYFEEYKYPTDMLEYLKANKPFFRALIPTMEEYGVNILFENSARKICSDGGCFPFTAEELNSLIEFMDHEMFFAAWDVGHANLDGLSQYDEIMTLSKNLRAVHIHDNNGECDEHSIPFLGKVDFDSVIRGLRDLGYDGYFTFECTGFMKSKRGLDGPSPLAKTPIEVKKQSFSLLHNIGKAMLSSYGIYEE